ncbi:MAG: DUF4881 domain-containing protein [Desulfobacterales bacterium]|jgi:hypothetical protein|nr:DUF4881 domain-containing protein [Desulfobacterales bacterium]
MLKKRYWKFLLVTLPLAALFGCVEDGKVDQGRVVAFDAQKRLVTIIRDVKMDPINPQYTHLPPLVYTLPEDPAETGPLPRAGRRLKLDADNNQIVLFDAATQNFKRVDFTPVEKIMNVSPDDARVKGKKFPIIDRGNKKTITIYSTRQRILETVQVGEEYLGLPDSTWEAGDEVRIYYKQEGKSLRFMNLTQTDLFKGK